MQGDRIQQGVLRCDECHTLYPIERGIVGLLDSSILDQESRHERTLRDQLSPVDDDAWELSSWSCMEITSTLEALSPLNGATVLELGCGGGRYTARMADQPRALLAVDFSRAALNKLASRIVPHWNIGLVHADCTRLVLKQKSFDRILSTLVSNLPSPAHRRAMYRLAAGALASGGRFVFSTHHYTFVDRLRRETQSGRYDAGGIFRYLFHRRELCEEAAEYFRGVQCRPIQMLIPFADRLGSTVVTLSRIAERIPLVNQLGQLLLVSATRPYDNAATDHD